MAVAGLLLLPLVGLGLVLTGWPAFAVLLAGSGLGALLSVAGGDARILSALPARLVGLLESDLLQALPLFVLMGALLNRLPLVDALFRTGVRLLGGGARAPRIVAALCGALLAPLCGSVGASVSMLSRAVAPRLARHGTRPDQAFALLAAAGTLGVVVPPSLVLILLGDAMLGAHTLALNLSGRAGRVLNTQDIFRAALVPAAAFLLLTLLIAAWPRRGDRERADAAPAAPAVPLRAAEIGAASGTVAFVLAVLGGVATGLLYAVEAAAAGATLLLVGGLLTGRLRSPDLRAVLDETLVVTGALFALLVAATTFTLVLRGLGSDRLLLDLVTGLPGGAAASTAVVMLVLGACAFVLDAFEIIFVVVPLLMPGLLVKVEDAGWVSALTLLTLQTSFLLPPVGYAFTLARQQVAPAVPFRRLAGALAPYLGAAALVLAATFSLPSVTHWADPVAIEVPALSDRDVQRAFDRLAPSAVPDLPPLPPPAFPAD